MAPSRPRSEAVLLAGAIRTYRRSARRSIDEVARLAGLPWIAWKALEQPDGAAPVDVALLPAVAAALHVPLTSFTRLLTGDRRSGDR